MSQGGNPYYRGIVTSSSSADREELIRKYTILHKANAAKNEALKKGIGIADFLSDFEKTDLGNQAKELRKIESFVDIHDKRFTGDVVFEAIRRLDKEKNQAPVAAPAAPAAAESKAPAIDVSAAKKARLDAIAAHIAEYNFLSKLRVEASQLVFQKPGMSLKLAELDKRLNELEKAPHHQYVKGLNGLTHSEFGLPQAANIATVIGGLVKEKEAAMEAAENTKKEKDAAEKAEIMNKRPDASLKAAADAARAKEAAEAAKVAAAKPALPPKPAAAAVPATRPARSQTAGNASLPAAEQKSAPVPTPKAGAALAPSAAPSAVAKPEHGRSTSSGGTTQVVSNATRFFDPAATLAVRHDEIWFGASSSAAPDTLAGHSNHDLLKSMFLSQFGKRGSIMSGNRTLSEAELSLLRMTAPDASDSDIGQAVLTAITDKFRAQEPISEKDDTSVLQAGKFKTFTGEANVAVDPAAAAATRERASSTASTAPANRPILSRGGLAKILQDRLLGVGVLKKSDDAGTAANAPSASALPTVAALVAEAKAGTDAPAAAAAAATPARPAGFAANAKRKSITTNDLLLPSEQSPNRRR